MLLDARCRYLVLHGGSEPHSRNIFIVESFDQALSKWTSCSRISPVWPLNGLSTNRTQDHFQGKCTLTFLGPHPLALLTKALPIQESPAMIGLWATAGAFNIALCTEDNEAGSLLRDKIWQYAANEKIAIEQWALHDGHIERVKYSALDGGDTSAILSRLGAFAGCHDLPTLRPIFQENLVATATSLARAAAVHPPIFGDLVQVADATCKIMEAYEAGFLTSLDMQSRLLSLNAALSRFSSQAFSGIPPIQETECHFWIHSLLGTGSANIALANLVSSIQTTLGEARIDERLQQMTSMRDKVPHLDDLTFGAKLLARDLIGEVPPNEGKKAEILPLITYFSGRDGFSSHLQTLSAPLTTIAECNSFRSNLLTVTHEISHIFVQAALSWLSPTPGDEDELKLAVKLLSPRYHAQNYLEAARQLLLEAIIGMEQAARDDFQDSEIKTELPAILHRNRQEVQEILVHAFDFLYFHAGDTKYYIRSIWHSWCSIPGIGDRVPDYLMRTLCAVSANLLKDAPLTRFAAALKGTKEILTEINSKVGKESNYVSLALEYIEHVERSATFRRKVEEDYHVRIYLVRLVKIFLYSDSVAAKLFADPYIGGGGKGYRSKRRLVYDTEPVGNLLQFLRSQLKSDPSEAESLWVLHCLAFAKSHDKVG